MQRKHLFGVIAAIVAWFAFVSVRNEYRDIKDRLSRSEERLTEESASMLASIRGLADSIADVTNRLFKMESMPVSASTDDEIPKRIRSLENASELRSNYGLEIVNLKVRLADIERSIEGSTCPTVDLSGIETRLTEIESVIESQKRMAEYRNDIEKILEAHKDEPAIGTRSTIVPTIHVYTSDLCGPCQLWKRDLKPYFEKSGWLVKEIKADSGTVPRFSVVDQKRRFEHVGFMSVETFNQLYYGPEKAK